MPKHAPILPDPDDLVLPDLDEVIASLSDCCFEGFCLECGSSQGNVEPDATNFRCEACGHASVFGADHCLLLIEKHATA